MVAEAHIDSHDLDLYVREHLDPERTSSIKLHVQNCGVCEHKLLTSMLARLADLSQKNSPSVGQDLRFEERVQKGEQGSLQMLCPLSFEQSPVQIVDVGVAFCGFDAPEMRQREAQDPVEQHVTEAAQHALAHPAFHRIHLQLQDTADDDEREKRHAQRKQILRAIQRDALEQIHHLAAQILRQGEGDAQERDR